MESINPPWKPGMHVLLLLLLGGSYVSCEEWCYDKPSCGPRTWYSLGQCNGANQSPINIETRKAMPGSRLGPLTFIGYEDRLRPKLLVNNGHYAEVEMKSGAAIFGRGLPDTYFLQSFHFHWDKSSAPGSEHAINGKRYDMEVPLNSKFVLLLQTNTADYLNLSSNCNVQFGGEGEAESLQK